MDGEKLPRGASFSLWKRRVKATVSTARGSFPAVLFAGDLCIEPFAFHESAADERATVGTEPKVSF